MPLPDDSGYFNTTGVASNGVGTDFTFKALVSTDFTFVDVNTGGGGGTSVIAFITGLTNAVVTTGNIDAVVTNSTLRVTIGTFVNVIAVGGIIGQVVTVIA